MPSHWSLSNSSKFKILHVLYRSFFFFFFLDFVAFGATFLHWASFLFVVGFGWTICTLTSSSRISMTMGSTEGIFLLHCSVSTISLRFSDCIQLILGVWNQKRQGRSCCYNRETWLKCVRSYTRHTLANQASQQWSSKHIVRSCLFYKQAIKQGESANINKEKRRRKWWEKQECERERCGVDAHLIQWWK